MSSNHSVSYSSLAAYKECPRLWAHQYLNRQPPQETPLKKEPSSGFSSSREQRQWEGVQEHQALEDFFNGAYYPSGFPRLLPWRDLFMQLRERGAMAELKEAVDENWRPVPYGSPRAMLVAKIDITLRGWTTLWLSDLKTGHRYASHELQGKVYTSIVPRGWESYLFTSYYLDLPCYTRTWRYSPEQQKVNRGELEGMIQVIRDDTNYDPTPGRACEHCPLNKRNGGDCDAGF